MNLVIKQTRVVEVPVTTLSVAATCQQAMLIDAAGQCVGSTSDMPAFMPTLLEIDLATGAIKNWNVPTVAQLQAIADGRSAAVAPTKLQEAVALVESPDFLKNRFGGRHTPDLVEIDDDCDDACLCSDIRGGFYAEPTTTPAPPQAVESAAVREDLQADCAPAGQQSKPLEIDGIKTPDHGWVAGLLVSVSEKAGKWSATTGQHTATSTQGKFEAINGALNKAGMGRCEINQQKDENGHPIEGLYLADDKNTKDRTTVYVSGHEIGKGHTARTSNGKKYIAPTESAALDGLLRDVLKVELPVDAIVDTTDDEMVFNDKQRFSIDMTKAVAIVEPVAEAEPVAAEHAPVEPVAEADDIKPVCTLKQKLEPLPAITDNGDLPSDFDGGDTERPEPVMDLSQPAPVDIVTELSLSPAHVMNQLIAVQQRQCDPIYSAFFAARGITENGKLSSKGTRLLAGLSQAESNERAEQIIKNACDVPATEATYDEIVALINHAPTQMHVLKLTDRISKRGNFAERQKLFAIQKDRIEALKADSAA